MQEKSAGDKAGTAAHPSWRDIEQDGLGNTNHHIVFVFLSVGFVFVPKVKLHFGAVVDVEEYSLSLFV